MREGRDDREPDFPSRGVASGACKFRSNSSPCHSRIAWLCLALVLGIASASGCAGNGNFLTGRPTQGQLKASLAHVEVENQQLQKQVAKLRSDNRSMEDRLVREEQANGDLTARLDSARNLLKDRGVELEDKRQASTRERRSSLNDDELDDLNAGDGSSRRTLPAGQKSRGSRKAPFVQIPNRIEDIDEDEDDVSSRRPTWAPGGQRTSKSSRQMPSGDPVVDDHARREDQLRWTSIGDLGGKGASQKVQR